MKRHEWQLLFKLVCDRQTELLKYNLWDRSEYKDLEHIKIRLKRKFEHKAINR